MFDFDHVLRIDESGQTAEQNQGSKDFKSYFGEQKVTIETLASGSPSRNFWLGHLIQCQP